MQFCDELCARMKKISRSQERDIQHNLNHQLSSNPRLPALALCDSIRCCSCIQGGATKRIAAAVQTARLRWLAADGDSCGERHPEKCGIKLQTSCEAQRATEFPSELFWDCCCCILLL